MRLVLGVLAIISTGALSQARATDPEPQATNSVPAQDSTAAQPASAPAASPDSATNAAAEAPAAAAKPGKPELTPDELTLISHGYKLEMRHGEKWFCKPDTVLGSRVNMHRICGTATTLVQARSTQQQDLRDSQVKHVGPGAR